MNKIIGISGKKRSGKDTLAKWLIDKQPGLEINSVSFAYKLREVCSMISGVSLDVWFDDTMKDMYLPQWDMTIRQMLQKIGTDAMRDGFHANVWVISLLASMHPEKNYIITDVRFKNEAEAVKNMGGIVIRVNASYPGFKSNDEHRSETELDDYTEFDHIIENKGDLEAFEWYAESLMSKLK